MKPKNTIKENLSKLSSEQLIYIITKQNSIISEISSIISKEIPQTSNEQYDVLFHKIRHVILNNDMDLLAPYLGMWIDVNMGEISMEKFVEVYLEDDEE